MRGLVLLALGGTGCQVVFPLDGELPPPPPDCSSMSMLTDNFGDGMFGPRWSGGPINRTLIEEDGVVRMAGNAPEPATFLEASHYLQLRGHGASVKVILEGDVAGGDIRLELEAQTGEKLIMGVLGDTSGGAMLVAGQVLDGTLLQIDSTPYLDDAHRFWRIAHDGFDLTTWEVSRDGVTFEQVFEREGLPWVGFMKPRFTLLTPLSITVRFDDFNGDVAPEVYPACPASTLADTFDGADFQPIWANRVTRGECTNLIAGGQLVTTFGPDDNVDDDCIVQSSTIYDLRDNAVTIQLADHLLEAAAASAFFGVRTFDGRIAVFSRSGSSIQSVDDMSVAPYGNATYDVDDHRFLKVSAADDTLLFEVSGDGRTFQPFGQTDNVGPLDAVSILMGIENDAPMTSFAHFDNVNVVPE